MISHFDLSFLFHFYFILHSNCYFHFHSLSFAASYTLHHQFLSIKFEWIRFVVTLIIKRNNSKERSNDFSKWATKKKDTQIHQKKRVRNRNALVKYAINNSNSNNSCKRDRMDHSVRVRLEKLVTFWFRIPDDTV